MPIDPERLEKARRSRAEMLEKYGWIADCVFDTETHKCDSGTGTDIHTHGLVENFNHPDLQIILPISYEISHAVLASAVKMIKEGKRFEAGKCYSGLLKDKFKVRLVKAIESDRSVLRIILPDQNGKLHYDTLETSFKVQYNGIKPQRRVT